MIVGMLKVKKPHMFSEHSMRRHIVNMQFLVNIALPTLLGTMMYYTKCWLSHEQVLDLMKRINKEKKNNQYIVFLSKTTKQLLALKSFTAIFISY